LGDQLKMVSWKPAPTWKLVSWAMACFSAVKPEPWHAIFSVHPVDRSRPSLGCPAMINVAVRTAVVCHTNLQDYTLPWVRQWFVTLVCKTPVVRKTPTDCGGALKDSSVVRKTWQIVAFSLQLAPHLELISTHVRCQDMWLCRKDYDTKTMVGQVERLWCLILQWYYFRDKVGQQNSANEMSNTPKIQRYPPTVRQKVGWCFPPDAKAPRRDKAEPRRDKAESTD
jgi:hypothetical protein